MKRYRTPKCKPGQLLLYWGKLPGDQPDVCVAWGGEGADKPDSRLLMSAFCSERLALAFGEDQPGPCGSHKWERSLVDELKARGYDITTLRVSIEQKRPAQPQDAAK